MIWDMIFAVVVLVVKAMQTEANPDLTVALDPLQSCPRLLLHLLVVG